jgi:glycosyltransferase involved in cell wall biosynthesis
MSVSVADHSPCLLVGWRWPLFFFVTLREGQMQTAQLDRDLTRPSEEAHAAALVASPLVVPEFRSEHEFERVNANDSTFVTGARAGHHDWRGAPCNEFDGASVTIVMGTYQGERFLKEQLDSIAAQSHRNWRLYVSDDGSTDKTRAVVQEFGAVLRGRNEVDLVDGPRKGFVANFLTSVCQARETDYYAFSDQDDVWEADKLERALSILESMRKDRPALYCGRTCLVDVAGRSIGLSPAFLRPPSFGNALVQSIGGGNTMVMNHAARELLRAAGPDIDVVSHDWWTYQLVSGAGGAVHYDLEPRLRYRQHGNNSIGANNTFGARCKRLRLLFEGGFKQWTDRNVRALGKARHLLTRDNLALLDSLVEVRSGSLPRNLLKLYRSGIYRQTWPNNIGLILATAFGKL